MNDLQSEVERLAFQKTSEPADSETVALEEFVTSFHQL